MPDLVSIVIPCYNHGRFLAEAVESALAQTHPNVETLVIDDGSTDETPEVAGRYGDRIRYFRTEHGGQQNARNRSLTEATGDFFVNLDADNRLRPRYIEAALAALKGAASPELGFIYTRRAFFGDKQGLSGLHAFNPDTLKMRNYIDMCSLIRMELVKRFGFDPDFNSGWQDFDFYLTLLENGYRGAFLEEPLVEYRVHSASVSHRQRGRYRHRQLMRKVIRKHAGLYSRHERHRAMQRARSRVVSSVLADRAPGVPFAQRCRALLALACASPTPLQLTSQAVYTLWPRRVAGSRDSG